MAGSDQAALQIARKNAYAPLLRKLYPQRGRGVKTLIIGFDKPHAAKVSQIIRGKQFGIAPEAQVRYLGLPEKHFEVPIPEIRAQQQLDAYLLETMTGALGAVTETLQQLVAMKIQGLPSPQLVNISIENSRATLVDALFHDILPILQNDNKQGKAMDPNLVRLLKWSRNARNPQVRQYWVQYVNQLFDSRQEIQQAQLQYNQAIKAVKSAGMTVIVPSGNSRVLLGPIDRPDGCINYFALSPDVISVGASNPHQTPINLWDDRVADFSGLNPTFLAPGESLLIEKGDNMLLSQGTSYSAGWAMGLMALMLEAQPWLTPEALSQTLKQGCENPGILPSIAGYGIVNPFRVMTTLTGFPGPQR